MLSKQEGEEIGSVRLIFLKSVVYVYNPISTASRMGHYTNHPDNHYTNHSTNHSASHYTKHSAAWFFAVVSLNFICFIESRLKTIRVC